MDNRLKQAFDSIEASPRMKRAVKAAIRKKSHDYGRDVLRLQQHRSRIAGCCACVLALCISLGVWNVPVTSISVDVNPSIELQVNVLDRVITLNGRNKDGEELASKLDIAGMVYDAAMQRILISDELAVYLDNGSKFVITVSGTNTEHTHQMLNKVACRAYALAEDENVMFIQADAATARAAKNAGLSVARYQAWQHLLLQDPNLPPEAVLELSMAEISQLIECEKLVNPCDE